MNQIDCTMTTASTGNTQLSLTKLPDEIIWQVLYYLPLKSLLACQSTSRRLNRLANEPLIWRQHCLMRYKYWDPKHNIQRKFADRVNCVDWRHLLVQRELCDRRIKALIDGILANQVNRIEKFEKIVAEGYDAKD